MQGCRLFGQQLSQVECDNRAVVTVNDTVYEADIGPFIGLCTLLHVLLLRRRRRKSISTASMYHSGVV